MQAAVGSAPVAVPSEHVEQCAVVRYCRRVLPAYGRRVFSVPNERKLQGPAWSKARQWAELHRAGAEPGVSDLLLPGMTPSGYGGIAIEMKRRKGSKTDPLQWVWLLHFLSLGWVAVRCKGSDEAIRIVKEHGYVE